MILSNKTVRWFKLASDPFTAELQSAKDVLLTTTFSIVELRVWKAIDEQQLAALVGDVGSGKSTIMAKILEEMEKNRLYRIVRVYSLGRRKLTPSQLCDAVIADLIGTPVYNSLETKVRLIAEAFEDIHKRGQKALLTIDEAHELPTQTLKDLKKLHEIRGKFHSPLAIVLVGQPRLWRRMQREVALKEVLERTEIVEIPGMRDKRGGMKEAHEYLGWKLQRAGGRQVEEIFSQDGLDMLMSHPAARYPLGINNLVSLGMAVAVEAKERLINADVMAHAFTQIGYDGQTPEEDEDEPAERVA